MRHGGSGAGRVALAPRTSACPQRCHLRDLGDLVVEAAQEKRDELVQE